MQRTGKAGQLSPFGKYANFRNVFVFVRVLTKMVAVNGSQQQYIQQLLLLLLPSLLRLPIFADAAAAATIQQTDCPSISVL